MIDLLETAHPYRAGDGEIRRGDGACTLSLPPVPRGYADAQIDDTQGLPRQRFLWKAPLRLIVQARVEPAIPSGTWGFGFWNDPFAVSFGQAGAARRLPCSPRALWFFHASPPNEFGFTVGRRDGWRAMSIEAREVPPLLLAPAAALAVLMAQVPIIRRPIMELVLRQVTAAEAELDPPDAKLHEYEIAWEEAAATFRVDGAVVLRALRPPRGPLGFIAWIDNQYAIATPRRGLRFGTLVTDRPQSLRLERASIAALPHL